MFYRGKRHQQLFEKAIEDQSYFESKALATIYLLTADCRLWSQTRRFVSGNHIMFSRINLTDVSPSAYTLYAIARDLFCGNRKIAVEDVTDADVVPTGVFNVVCNALAVCRYGMDAVDILHAEAKRV